MRLIAFDFDGRQLSRVDHPTPSRRAIGIWWQQADTLLAFRQPVDMLTERSGLLDTDLSHDEVWSTARPLLGCSEQAEYFDVSRGRVLYDAGRQCGMIYHGNATPREMLEQLADVFGLPHWEDWLDEHYLTGDALEQFFSMEEETPDDGQQSTDSE